MKLPFEQKIPIPERQLLKRCGYNQILDRMSGKISYVRTFGAGHYPRFHCYIDVENNNFQINLHLDQKKPSYGGETAHSGEYDGPVVEREGERVRQVVNSLLGINHITSKNVKDDEDQGYDLSMFG